MSSDVTARPHPVVTLEGVGRTHGSGAHAVPALSDISLAVSAGELVAVMGPSGSGKSTLLNLAGAIDRPTSGRVLIEGSDITGLDQQQLAALRRRRIGMVFQDFNLLPTMTAGENVALPMELDGYPARRARAIALESLESLGLPETADRFPDELSGGQRQRVSIARALVGERCLVLADEPTGALDSATGEHILGVLRQRCDAGAAGLMVTHEARDAAWADRVLFLRDGSLVDSTGDPSTPEHLLRETAR